MSIRALFVPTASLALAAAGFLAPSAPADAAVLFYGGDIAVGNSTPSYAPNGEGSGGSFDRAYASFTVPAGQSWTVNGIFAHIIFQGANTLTNITSGRYEIRSGVSEGNAGSSVAVGTGLSLTVTDTGINAIFGLYDVGLVEATLSTSVVLTGGQYWVAFTPDSTAVPNILMGTTFGANAVNPSPGNDYRHSSIFNLNFTPTFEPALGLRGTAIPAPGAAALLLAGTALVSRRRRAS